MKEDIDDKVLDIVERYKSVFQGIGRASVAPIHIYTKPNSKPRQQKQRPVALHFKERMEDHVKELVAGGVVDGPLDSKDATGWISNPVITAKKWSEKKIRLNLDMRHMKDIVQTTHFPMPTSSQLRHNLAGSDKFTTLDMNHSYHQFPLDEESKNLFVFYTPWGLHRFNTLVMGAHTASSECQETIRRVLVGLDGCEQIQDDLVVHGKGEEHDRRLDAVLKRLREYNITLRREKCHFGQPEVLWFGNVYSCQGMSPDPAKVQIIKDWPAPGSKSEIKSFLQTVQFCAVFMRPGGGRTYADVTSPLRKLTAKQARFKWDKQCQDSFVELKTLLCSDMVMANYEVGRDTRLYVDHGPEGLGATVAQKYDLPDQSQSVWRPVHHGSRSLKESELNYGKPEGESLAILSGILSNKMYLYGTHFEVITDHAPLVSMYNSPSKPLPVIIAKHKSKLQQKPSRLCLATSSTGQAVQQVGER